MGGLPFDMSVCMTNNNIAKMQRCLGFKGNIQYKNFL